ncbi:allophanate hydrolase subunit 1 [uncultured Vibrio sp.]|uniref:5-oxoprolinase subunit B family protein n=1 Tax=uncultured Vibrio sp. TaxID=114054 RepID=UPI0025E19187|nr:allophanate hydrolase subunit 1 [uncultured Vibrio sp.]
MSVKFSIEPVAECSLLVRFNEKPTNTLSLFIGHCSQAVAGRFPDWIMNVTPSYDSVLVDYLPHRIDMLSFINLLDKTIRELNVPTHLEKQSLVLPAFYDDAVGLELPHYYKLGLSLEDVIRLHTQQEYSVGAIGFAPGFAFLTGVHPTLQRPRLASPRLNVAKGSIAIANHQTSVYPSPSPGGWNIIGNCPIDLYDPDTEIMTPFSIGSTVRFRSISKDEFLSLGGIL